jgi:hypothetical protein
MKKLRHILITLVVTGCVLAGGYAASPSAQAATRNGNCEWGEFCLYFNSGLTGAVADFHVTRANYGVAGQPATHITFKPATGITAGRSSNGAGVWVQDNSASYVNNSPRCLYVFTEPGWGGMVGVIRPGEVSNLVGSFKNNIASHYFFAC